MPCTSCGDRGGPWWQFVNGSMCCSVPGAQHTGTLHLHVGFGWEKIGRGGWGVAEVICDGKGSRGAGIGLPFASKTAMVIDGKRGFLNVGICRCLY